MHDFSNYFFTSDKTTEGCASKILSQIDACLWIAVLAVHTRHCCSALLPEYLLCIGRCNFKKAYSLVERN